jgi:hypothetical protein
VVHIPVEEPSQRAFDTAAKVVRRIDVMQLAIEEMRKFADENASLGWRDLESKCPNEAYGRNHVGEVILEILDRYGL